MIKPSISISCALVLLSLSLSVHAAGGYKAGDAESVKGWAARDFESAKTAGMPLCVYIYDSTQNNNTRAKALEGASLLANADVKAKLKSFIMIKIKTDGTDVKGWPATILSHAGKGGAVMLASSDFSQMLFIDKDTQLGDIKATLFLEQAAGILSYEKKNPAGAGAVAAKDEKKGPMPALPEEKKTVPGLAMDKDKDPKDKKDEKKPAEKKKAAPADE